VTRPGDHSFAMKHWQETLDVARRIAGSAAGQKLAVATVVHIDGSAYRRPGAKLLIEGEGTMRGGVSGGCLEADVQAVALDAMQQGRACSRHYQTGADEDTLWGLGLGCEGAVEVFVQPIEPGMLDTWRAIARLLDGDEAFAIATVLDGPAAGRVVVVAGARVAAGGVGNAGLDGILMRRAESLISSQISALERIEAARVFTEVLAPPPWLSVFGAGDDAMPLVRLAAAIGFRVAVVDHRAAFVTPERFPDAHRRVIRRAGEGLEGIPIDSDAAAVVMTHALEHDRAWVRALLTTPVGYVGVLGPRSRISRMLESAGDASEGRIFGPVGLDIGAEGPEQIAVSILAEVLAVRASRAPRHLREREAAIHA